MLLKHLCLIPALALSMSSVVNADENTYWEAKFKTGKYIEITKPLPFTNQVHVKVKELAYKSGDFKVFNTTDSYIVSHNGTCLNVAKFPAEPGYPGYPAYPQQIGNSCGKSWDESVGDVANIIKDRTEYVWKKDKIGPLGLPGLYFKYFLILPKAITLIPHTY